MVKPVKLVQKSRNRIRRSLGSRIFDICNVVFFVILSLLMILPFYNVIVISFMSQGEFFSRMLNLIPRGFNLEAYRFLFAAPTLPRAFLISVIVTVTGTALSTLFTSMIAYPLSKKRLMGRKVFTVYLLITMFFSGGLIPTFLLITQTLGWRNNLLALIVPSAVSVWNFIIMRAFFMQLPESLEESAKMDGASDLTILFRIIYPLSIPVLATLSLFVAVGHWNAWFSAQLYIANANLIPLQLLLRRMLNAGMPMELIEAYGQPIDAFGNRLPIFLKGREMAAVVVSVVPMLMIYPFLQKYFEKGAMLGSVKG